MMISSLAMRHVDRSEIEHRMTERQHALAIVIGDGAAAGHGHVSRHEHGGDAFARLQRGAPVLGRLRRNRAIRAAPPCDRRQSQAVERRARTACTASSLKPDKVMGVAIGVIMGDFAEVRSRRAAATSPATANRQAAAAKLFGLLDLVRRAAVGGTASYRIR